MASEQVAGRCGVWPAGVGTLRAQMKDLRWGKICFGRSFMFCFKGQRSP